MKGKILVVDDDDNARTTLKDVFEESGYKQVQVAKDGVDALEKIKKFTPDLIILDLNMPNMGGVEFYSQICGADNNPKYPVFVITGRAEMESLFKDFDVVGFITKPFDIQKLLAEVDIVFDKKYENKINQEGAKRVMIVNTDDGMLKRISEVFINFGYDVRTATNGTTALKELMEDPVDMALIEMGLDDISGDIVAFKLKNIQKTANIISLLYTFKAVEYRIGVYEKINQKTGVEVILNFSKPEELLEEANKIFIKHA